MFYEGVSRALAAPCCWGAVDRLITSVGESCILCQEQLKVAQTISHSEVTKPD